MALGGGGLSRAEAKARRSAPTAQRGRQRQQASARLGLRLRSVLLSPATGFESALADLTRLGGEGITPFVLAFLGGSSLALLWLKVGALIGWREVCDASLIPGYVSAAGVLGGVLMLLGQALWGSVGPRAARLLDSDEATPASSRVVWGLAATPLVVVLVVLLPLDLLIVGSGAFTTDRLADPVSTLWAALSIAVWFSAAIWSLYLLMRGFQAQTKLSAGRAWLGALASCLCLALIVSAFVLATSVVPQGAGCRT